MAASKKFSPPKFPQRLLLWFLRGSLAEEVQGDLEEKFSATLRHKPLWRAQLNYWYQVVNYFRPFAIRKRSPYAYLNTNAMYKNYFRVAFRNLIKNKMHSGINITGLSVGLAVSLTIGIWIWDELSFNKSLPNHDRISQVIQNVTNNGEVQTWRSVPYPLAEELRKNYGDDFEHISLSTGLYGHVLTVGEKKVNLEGIYSEPSMSRVLTLKPLIGTASIEDASAILISASAAKALFGDKDPLGHGVDIDGEVTLQITGVFEDLPDNSHFGTLDFVAPWQALVNATNWIKSMEDPWRPNAFVLMVMLAPGANAEAVSARIRDAKLKNVNSELAKKKPELFLHPLDQWHLYAEFKNGKNVGGRIQYVWLFGIVGGIVLLMACINFMNLSTARSEKRAKEVGIRKAVGSFRGQLITQFLSESVLIAFLAFAISIIFVQLSLPAFNQLASKNMSIPWSAPEFWITGVGFALVTGLIAGSYPAFYLSSMHSVATMKGSTKAGWGALNPRKALVVMQFTFSVMLIIGTLVVFKQIQFAKNRPLGYDNKGLISVSPGNNNIHNHFDAIKRELESSGVIVAMAEASTPTTETWSTSSGFAWNGKDPNLSIDFPFVSISHDYGKTIGWEIALGRDFSRDFLSDSVGMIINESAARYMGFKDPLGETIRWFGSTFHVIGVVKDVITRSPYEPVGPLIYYLSSEGDNFVIMKINPERSAGGSIAAIEETFKKFNPEQPFQYQFMDESYARKFGNEERIGRLAGYFALLAVLISCLGTFGLASFVAEQRTKELGIRKVLGASAMNLWAMLSKDFVVLVVVACGAAIPLAYFGMKSWLQNYSYRTEIPAWIFGGSVLGILLITMITVSYHALKAVATNPVRSLRSE